MMNTEEYVSLRQEVIENQKFVLTTVGFVLTAAGLLLGIAIQSTNPIMALFALVILYLGQKLVCNNAQTEARAATYLMVFWETRTQDFHWEQRQAKYRQLVAAHEQQNGRVSAFLHWLFGSVLEEQWMATTVQWAFYFIGWLCIAIYLLLWQSTDWQFLKSSPTPVPNPLANVWLFYLLAGFSILFWIRILFRLPKQTQPFRGRENMMDEMLKIWQRVRRTEKPLEQELKEEEPQAPA
jgi:hypothetical protein